MLSNSAVLCVCVRACRRAGGRVCVRVCLNGPIVCGEASQGTLGWLELKHRLTWLFDRQFCMCVRVCTANKGAFLLRVYFDTGVILL